MAPQTKQMALLAHARENSTFDSQKLTTIIYDKYDSPSS